MPKLKSDPIQKDDIVDYLDSCSDFSFELSVLKMLRGNDVICEHGGLYEDPVTGKSREFDIRAIKTISNYRIRLAIECKNIRENFPVVVSCMPRHEEESYHQIAMVSEPESSLYAPLIYQSRARTISLRNENSIYKIDMPVGKSTAQVGRGMDGTISANDGELYDKWSQSLSSTADLVSRTYWDGDKKDDENLYFSAIFPIIVVPNERLWTVYYDDNGNRIQEPCISNRCSSFIDKEYEMGTKIAPARMWISHIEIMTFDGLYSFVDSYLKTKEGASVIFPREGIIKAFGHE
jgi:hypothetical protein